MTPVQWYPGHMAKTRRMLLEQLALVDMVIEVLDARIPLSSRNPDLNALAAGKPRVVLLNKSDLAAPSVTKAWLSFCAAQGERAIAFDARDTGGAVKLRGLVAALHAERREKQEKRGRLVTPRALVAGIPNVGKSAVINCLAGRAAATTGDKPGVTRGRQWVRTQSDLELLDTPGVLWPKFDDPQVGVRLAVTGAVPDAILDTLALAEALVSLLLEAAPQALSARYKIIVSPDASPRDCLTRVAAARGFKLRGGETDTERAALTLLGEFRAGKLGRVTLERPPD